MQKITYISDDNSSFNSYIFDFIFSTLGIAGERKVADHADIYYGNNKNSTTSKFAIGMESQPSKPWADILNQFDELSNESGILSHDLISSIGFFLKDTGNSNLCPGDLDKFGRLIFEKSFQFRAGISEIPIVNAYILLIKNLLKRNLGISGCPIWPKGKRCAIGLSHDVDFPNKYARLEWPVFKEKSNIKNMCINNISRPFIHLKRILDKNPWDFWLFEDIVAEEKRLGLESTFFFSSINASNSYASSRDVLYDIKNKKFKKVFDLLNENDFEIGLHASYNAYQDADRFVLEKCKLEKAADCEVSGLRHHYWHMGPFPEKTMRMHEAAGFKYDSSLAFNDHIGFRKNIALPYYPWIDEISRPVNVMQIPMFCMDGNLFPRFDNSQDAFLEIKRHIDVIKKYNGIGIIDWHVRTSYPKNEEYWLCGETYCKVIKYLAGDSEIWTTNLENINKYLSNRSQSIIRSQ
jgi:hypothetical protein